MYFSYGNDYQVSRYLCIIVPFCITHNLCLIFSVSAYLPDEPLFLS